MSEGEIPVEKQPFFLGDECVRLSKIIEQIDAMNREKNYAYDESIFRARAAIAALKQRIARIQSIVIKTT